MPPEPPTSQDSDRAEARDALEVEWRAPVRGRVGRGRDRERAARRVADPEPGVHDRSVQIQPIAIVDAERTRDRALEHDVRRGDEGVAIGLRREAVAVLEPHSGPHRCARPAALTMAAGIERAADELEPRDRRTRHERGSGREERRVGRDVESFEADRGRLRSGGSRRHRTKRERLRQENDRPMPIGRPNGERLRQTAGRPRRRYRCPGTAPMSTRWTRLSRISIDYRVGGDIQVRELRLKRQAAGQRADRT